MDTDQYITALGNAFRSRREKLGMTHEDVAEASDLNVNYYARIERGEVNTSVKKLVLISKALDTELSKLAAAAEQKIKTKR
jgi:transcriptional regulator with XRE-family HTH domain